eukprot:15459700-Heterocapsa_arctica.AAC.1
MQHGAEVVAGLDVASVIPTRSSGNGTTAPPPRGGFPKTSVLVIALVPLTGLCELPLLCVGKLPKS